jgi:transcriptional regulator with PAS, ATPase and Fis domain
MSGYSRPPVEKSETTEETGSNATKAPRTPGAVVVCSRHAPMFLPIPLERGPTILGRNLPDGTRLPDERVSREHLEISVDKNTWTLRDLGSTNGTFIDGVRVAGVATREISTQPRVVRIGNTMLLLYENIEPFRASTISVIDGVVVGPTLAHTLSAVERAARLRGSVLLVGESGTGKEFAAHRFHRSGPVSSGPLVAVNCAAIPEGVAESLLFGARRGAFSGATETSLGYLQSADGGVLFLDEFGELSLEVQAKLLRVIETKEVLAVGASRPQQVDVRLCFATNRNLRADVAAGKFRADLYYRIQTPQVVLPPLRDRIAEVPWLIELALTSMGEPLHAHARFVEACMLRSWPGNIRELLSEVREAAGAALDEGAKVVTEEHLRTHAGVELGPASLAGPPSALAGVASERGSISGVSNANEPPLTREAIEAELATQGQNLAATARALGVHRTQLYRRMAELEMPTPGRRRDRS